MLFWLTDNVQKRQFIYGHISFELDLFHTKTKENGFDIHGVYQKKLIHFNRKYVYSQLANLQIGKLYLDYIDNIIPVLLSNTLFSLNVSFLDYKCGLPIACRCEKHLSYPQNFKRLKNLYTVKD